MNTLKKLTYIFVTLTLSSYLQANECKPNGCGTGWNEPLVPEKIGVLGVDFTQACSDHDVCYSVCAPCGNNFSNFATLCDQSKEAIKKRRAKCDTQFRTTMVKSCLNNPSGLKKIGCGTIANGYFGIVKIAGGGSFNGKEVEQYLRFLASDDANGFDHAAFELKLANTLSLNQNINSSIKLKVDDDGVKAQLNNTKIFEPNIRYQILQSPTLSPILKDSFDSKKTKLNPPSTKFLLNKKEQDAAHKFLRQFSSMPVVNQ